MADVFIIVDNEPASKTTLAYNLRATIAKMTKNKYTAELVEGVLISKALSRVMDCVQNVAEEGEDSVAGILVDLVEKGDPESGVTLLRQIKQEHSLSGIPVVIFTSTLVDTKRDEWIDLGAMAVIQRDLHSGEPAHVQLAKEVLAAFGVKVEQ